EMDLTDAAYTPPLPPPSVGTPPLGGFFRIWQGSASGYIAGDDGQPTAPNTNDHALHFTVNLGSSSIMNRSNMRRPESYMTSLVPTGSAILAPASCSSGPENPIDYQFDDGSYGYYSSQWAEVAYFLRPSPGTGAAGEPQLNALYRRQL